MDVDGEEWGCNYSPPFGYIRSIDGKSARKRTCREIDSSIASSKRPTGVEGLQVRLILSTSCIVYLYSKPTLKRSDSVPSPSLVVVSVFRLTISHDSRRSFSAETSFELQADRHTDSRLPRFVPRKPQCVLCSQFYGTADKDSLLYL